MYLVFVILYFVLVVVGFIYTASGGRTKAFGIYLILTMIGAGILLSISCNEVVWVGKIPLCR